MLLTVPAFEVATYLSEPDSYGYSLELIVELGGANTKAGKLAFNNAIKF